MKLLIKNARIVSDSGVFHGDVRIEAGIISRIDSAIPVGGAEVFDAGGKYLLPGGVDVHTHFDLDLGAVRATDNFYTGTVAAACGGTTTIVDHMAFGPKGCRLGHQVEVYHQLARDAVIDYSFHGVFQHVDAQVLADMEALIAQGITSYKVYLTYGGKLEDPDVLRVLERAAELGLMICVHSENDAIVSFLTQRLLAAGVHSPSGHPLSRPSACESEAVYRMLAFAAVAGNAPLYIVHLTSGQGLQAIQEARFRGQRHVFAETCPQYLFLDESRYADATQGLKYIMSPPLRTPKDTSMLWDGVIAGDIDVIATDHCPFNFAIEKQRGRDNFSLCPGGIPGVELRLALLFSQGFMEGRLSLPDMVRRCCTRPAQLFGLYPRKGAILPGADADLVLFDPDKHWTVTHSCLHERVDYTPYEGMALQGAPVVTWSRGEIIVRNGVPQVKPGRGQFIRRMLPDLS